MSRQYAPNSHQPNSHQPGTDVDVAKVDVAKVEGRGTGTEREQATEMGGRQRRLNRLRQRMP